MIRTFVCEIIKIRSCRFYGGIDYDLEVDAFSLGRAVTTGRLAAQYAVE